jgi:hypothetical protein
LLTLGDLFSLFYSGEDRRRRSDSRDRDRDNRDGKDEFGRDRRDDNYSGRGGGDDRSRGASNGGGKLISFYSLYYLSLSFCSLYFLFYRFVWLSGQRDQFGRGGSTGGPSRQSSYGGKYNLF